MALHAAPGAPADGSPSVPHLSNGTSPAMPLTPQAPGEADEPSREPDPPGQEAGDLCPSQEPEPVPREQGLRAWAAALAATLPPLTSSQAAAVARIAARLDARGDGQDQAALRSPRHLANTDAAHHVAQVGTASTSPSWLYDQMLAPQRHLEQGSLSRVVGGVPSLPPLHAARSQRLLFPEDGAGIGDCAPLGLEAGYAFIDWLDDHVVAGEGDLPSSEPIGEGFRHRFGLGDLDVKLDGFAGCRVGGAFDLIGVARVRQDLHHERTCR